MKKKVFINSHMFAVSASIVCLVLSGCGKSAETIKDYGSGDTVAEASVETQKDLEGKPDDKNIQEENWKETLNGDGKLFNDITISASLKNDGSDIHVITVQADEYNKDVNITGNAALTGTLATIIAEQVALMMVVILAASAAASSNN